MKKVSQKKNVTLDDLALMVAKGFRSVDERFDGVDARLDGIDVRLDGIDIRLDGIDVRLDDIDDRLDSLDVRLGHVEKEVLIVKGEVKKNNITLVSRNEFQALTTRVVKLEKIKS